MSEIAHAFQLTQNIIGFRFCFESSRIALFRILETKYNVMNRIYVLISALEQAHPRIQQMLRKLWTISGEDYRKNQASGRKTIENRSLISLSIVQMFISYFQ